MSLNDNKSQFAAALRYLGTCEDTTLSGVRLRLNQITGREDDQLASYDDYEQVKCRRIVDKWQLLAIEPEWYKEREGTVTVSVAYY